MKPKLKPLRETFVRIVGGGHIHLFSCQYGRQPDLYVALNIFAHGMDHVTFAMLQAISQQATGQTSLLGFSKYIDKYHSRAVKQTNQNEKS